MTSDKTNNNEKVKYWPLCALSIGVVGLFVLSWLCLETTINNPEKQGQFGDQFGAVNALFSGLAFAGLIFTIILQKKELALQREELSQTKDELRGQKEQMENQNKTLNIQRFENTFFHMMELQQQVVNDLYSKDNIKNWVEEDNPNPGMGTIRKQVNVEHIYQGRNLFYFKFAVDLHPITDTKLMKGREVYGLGGVMTEKGFSQYDAYNTSSSFDHYFRLFYRILKFIKQNESWLPYEQQYQYASMLRATLSRYELVWLYYNGLSENGKEKLKPLMEYYSILKNMRAELLVLCKENAEKIINSDATPNEINISGFTNRDYDFFLTDEKNNSSKYYLGAFYNKKELHKGLEYYERWKKFCKEKNIELS